MSRVPRAIPLAIVAAFLLSVAPPAQAADPEHDPKVECRFWRQAATLVFSATAYVATPHVPPAQLTVVCKYKNRFAWYSTTNTAPGPVVNSTSAGPQTAAEMTVCGYAIARYADGHTGTGTMGDLNC